MERYKPTNIYDEKILKIVDEMPNEYVETGCISGSKIEGSTLGAIITMIGVGKTFDAYTRRKFRRGHDVEAMYVEMLTGIPKTEQAPNVWLQPKEGYPIQNPVKLQAEPVKGYRGMTNSVDLLEDIGHGVNVHEIKSTTKMAYDKVAGSGRSKDKGYQPYEHYSIQASSYSLSDWGKPVVNCIMHYVNADDYRTIAFFINYNSFKEEIDRRIDAIQNAFATKEFPIFEPLNDWEKIKKYSSHMDEWRDLNPVQIKEKIRVQYPEAYKTFMETNITNEGKS